MNYSALRKTLRAGSIVFGSSAILLVFLPSRFLDLLGLNSSDALVWSMRMIGVTVFALAGNMWNHASQRSNARIGNVAKIMCVSAAGLGVLTLMIPVEPTWFAFVYAAIGFGFSLSYLINLLRK